MKKYFVFLIFASALISCNTATTFKVTKAGEEPEKYIERSLYVLPQTVLQVRVEFEQETYIPGPYRYFTRKYLGLEEFIEEPAVNFRLANVEVESFSEPDPDQYYSINLIKGSPLYLNYLELSEYGHVLDPSGFHSVGDQDNESPDDQRLFYFTDRTVKRNLTEVTDTLYKTVIRDSSYVRIPILRKQREAKTLEQKAEEAANFIIKIRKRRFKLLAGQYELFPEGEALGISVKELDKLEKEYLELFLGKRVKRKFSRTFLVTPENSTDQQEFTLAEFSGTNGLSESGSGRGNPLLVEIIPLQKPRALRGSNSLNANNTFYYRVPDLADVKVRIGEQLLWDGRHQVYQAGEITGFRVFTE